MHRSGGHRAGLPYIHYDDAWACAYFPPVVPVDPVDCGIAHQEQRVPKLLHSRLHSVRSLNSAVIAGYFLVPDEGALAILAPYDESPFYNIGKDKNGFGLFAQRSG